MKDIHLGLDGGSTVFALGSHASMEVFVEALLRELPGTCIVVIRQSPPAVARSWPSSVCEQQLSLGGMGELTAQVARCRQPIGCVFGWPDLLPQALIAAFGGRLFNLHSGDLPRYRGAGGGSWQVLNNETRITAHIQQMQHELDRGPLLLAETEAFGTPRPYPRDVKAAAARAAARVAERLAQHIAQGATLELHPQSEDHALYFPRLSTAENGWIDFSWSALAIERFVRAFSDPHEGAAFRCADQVYRARRARLRADQCEFHPFCAGLVVNTTAHTLDIALVDGVLQLSELFDAAGAPVAPRGFRIGARCWNSPADLLAAQRFRPTPAR